MRGRRILQLAAAGQLDAGFASLATFGLQIFAVRVFSVVELGAFGLVFSAFVFATQIPNQLVMSPMEVLSIAVDEPDRVAVLRDSVKRGLVIALFAGMVVPLGLLPVAGDASSDFLIVLGASAALAAVVSPIQDHIRKVLHLSGRSEKAAAVSLVQLIVAGVSVFAIARVDAAAAPFGALVVANVVSSGFGLAVSGAWRVPQLERMSYAEVWSLGKWLIVDSISANALSYGTVAVIGGAAGAAILGTIEGARVVARPIQVAAQGLASIVGPRSMVAGRTADRSAANAWRLRFAMLLAPPVLLYVAVMAIPYSRAILEDLLPNSFVVPHLAVATVGAVTFGVLAQPFMAELSGALLQSRLALWSFVSGLAQLLLAWALLGLGAFVYPTAVAGSGILRSLGLFASAERIYESRGSETPEFGDHVSRRG